jgi:hypothetical protein
MTAGRDQRRRDARWRVGHVHALAVLGLLGTGWLAFVNLGGVVRIRRGGVRLIDHIPRRRPELLP